MLSLLATRPNLRRGTGAWNAQWALGTDRRGDDARRRRAGREGECSITKVPTRVRKERRPPLERALCCSYIFYREQKTATYVCLYCSRCIACQCHTVFISEFYISTKRYIFNKVIPRRSEERRHLLASTFCRALDVRLSSRSFVGSHEAPHLPRTALLARPVVVPRGRIAAAAGRTRSRMVAVLRLRPTRGAQCRGVLLLPTCWKPLPKLCCPCGDVSSSPFLPELFPGLVQPPHWGSVLRTKVQSPGVVGAEGRVLMLRRALVGSPKVRRRSCLPFPAGP